MAHMKTLDCTLPSPAQNLACDEALLDLCEAGFDHDILRFWEPREHFVVLGYSSRIRAEVELSRCRAGRIAILRRCSGGGTVLQGPGCLNFSLILRLDASTRPAGLPAGLKGPELLTTISGTTRFVMETHRTALEPVIGGAVAVAGFSDLARNGLKFSGNAQRRKRRAALVHGTFLLGLDLRLIEEVLPLPERQPPYRGNRPHREFLANLRVPAGAIKQVLAAAWRAAEPFGDPPLPQIEALVRERYATEAWTHRF